MKLLLFTRSLILYAVVKGQSTEAQWLLSPPLPDDEGWSALYSQEQCSCKLGEFVKSRFNSVRQNSNLLKVRSTNVENSGLEPLTSTLQK